MKKSVIYVIIGVAIVVGGIAYVRQSNNTSSDEANLSADNQSQLKNNSKYSSNFQKIKDEKLDGELVDSFPKEQVPLYPGEVVSSLGKMDVYLDRAEWNVAITTSDTFAAVDASIREAYESGDWSIATDNKSGLGGTMLIARSNKYTAAISYDDMGTDGISINYGVSQR